MKKPVVFIAMVSLYLCCATLSPEQLTVQDVVDVRGKTKKVIYTASLEWIETTFKTHQTVVEYKNPESAKIVGSIITTGRKMLHDYKFKSRITIDIKDNKARLTFEPQSLSISFEDVLAEKRSTFTSSEKTMAHETIAPVRKSYMQYLKTGKRENSW